MRAKPCCCINACCLSHKTASKSYEDFREENELGTRSDSDLLTARSQLLLRQVELSEAHQLLLDSRDQFMLLLNQSGIESRRQLRRGNLRGLFDHVWIVPTSAFTE